MQTIFLKIDFYWWAKLLLIFKFKDSNARAHALLWGPRQSRSVQHTFTLSLTRGLDLQALVTEPIVFCEWLPPPVWEILEVFFFFSILSPWIAAYVSKLPWWLWMLPACPQLSCNIWSGVLVCQWAGQSLKNIFVCKRYFLKSFKPLQRPLRFSKTLWTSTSSEKEWISQY